MIWHVAQTSNVNHMTWCSASYLSFCVNIAAWRHRSLLRLWPYRTVHEIGLAYSIFTRACYRPNCCLHGRSLRDSKFSSKLPHIICSPPPNRLQYIASTQKSAMKQQLQCVVYEWYLSTSGIDIKVSTLLRRFNCSSRDCGLSQTSNQHTIPSQDWAPKTIISSFQLESIFTLQCKVFHDKTAIHHCLATAIVCLKSYILTLMMSNIRSSRS